MEPRRWPARAAPIIRAMLSPDQFLGFPLAAVLITASPGPTT